MRLGTFLFNLPPPLPHPVQCGMAEPMRDCEACISQSSCWPARLGVGFRANHPTLSTTLLTSEIPSLQKALHATCYIETLHVKEEFKISLFYKPTSARHQVIAVRLVCPLSDDTFLRTPNRTQFHLCLFQPSIPQKHSLSYGTLQSISLRTVHLALNRPTPLSPLPLQLISAPIYMYY